MRIIACALLFLCTLQMHAQMRHFYYRIDTGTGNGYMYNLVGSAGDIANTLTNLMLFDDAYVHTFYSGNIDGEKIKTKCFRPWRIKARNLFNDLYVGAKLGYQTDYQGFVNWGLFASAHYRLNQVRALFPDEEDYSYERFKYIKPGAGLMITLGGVRSANKVQIEAALRYDYPVGYKGIYEGKAGDILKTGISSHFSLKWGGYSSSGPIGGQSIGLFADITHHNLYKGMVNSKFRAFDIGISWSYVPAIRQTFCK